MHWVISHIDLQQLSTIRLEEAEALQAAGKYDGCVYLCGYVVEMALKACICRTLNITQYPDNENGVKQIFKTHDFAQLELLSGLRSAITSKRRASAIFESNWSLVTSWKPDDRYAVNQSNATDAADMLEALRSDTEGVLTWLSQQW